MVLALSAVTGGHGVDAVMVSGPDVPRREPERGNHGTNEDEQRQHEHGAATTDESEQRVTRCANSGLQRTTAVAGPAPMLAGRRLPPKRRARVAVIGRMEANAASGILACTGHQRLLAHGGAVARR